MIRLLVKLLLLHLTRDVLRFPFAALYTVHVHLLTRRHLERHNLERHPVYQTRNHCSYQPTETVKVCRTLWNTLGSASGGETGHIGRDTTEKGNEGSHVEAFREPVDAVLFVQLPHV